MKKKPLREILADNAKAMSIWSGITGKETPSVYKFTQEDKPARKKYEKNTEIPTEHQEQVAFIKWFRHQYPKVRIFAVPNAAMRSYEGAAYMTAEGMSKGCPDLWIPEWRMAIEMKRTKGGSISDEQRDWNAYLLSIGWNAKFCYGFEDAKNACINRKNVDNVNI